MPLDDMTPYYGPSDVEVEDANRGMDCRREKHIETIARLREKCGVAELLAVAENKLRLSHEAALKRCLPVIRMYANCDDAEAAEKTLRGEAA